MIYLMYKSAKFGLVLTVTYLQIYIYIYIHVCLGIVVMIADIDISQEIFAIDVLTALTL